MSMSIPLPTGGGSGSGSGFNARMVGYGGLYDRFWAIVQAEVASNHLMISNNCREHIQRLIVSGVRYLLESNGSHLDIISADMSLRQFVQNMIISARQRNSPTLNETDFHAAVSFWKPCPPFCG